MHMSYQYIADNKVFYLTDGIVSIYHYASNTFDVKIIIMNRYTEKGKTLKNLFVNLVGTNILK
jgi:hypothetical protein